MIAGTLACMSKSGMHEDEFYSYYSSNRTNGFYAEHTVSTEVMLDELKVLDGCGYNFPLVKEVQSWDVHPPIYYFVLHFVCSLTSGVFSKWQGLVINLICLAISIILMKRLGTIMLPDNPLLVDIAVLTWGLSPALLSGVVFIRMYMLLTVWILAVTLLHVKNLPGRTSSLKFWILLWILTFLGFMTHYYFLIWLVFLGGAWNVILILNSIKARKMRKTSLHTTSTTDPASSDDPQHCPVHPTIIYILVELSCAAVCYLFYPAFPAQMFKGQRGAQATGNFFDLSNTWDRLCFFASKINRLGFGGGLWILLGLVLISYNLKLMKTDGRLKYQNSYMAPRELFDPGRKWENGKVLPPDDITGTQYMINDNDSEYDVSSSDPIIDNPDISSSMPGIRAGRSSTSDTPGSAITSPVMICLTIALIGYFIVISKTALILGDSSIRYHIPVLGIGYLVIAILIKNASSLWKWLPWPLITAILILNLIGDFTERICFLYPENKEHLQTLSDHRDADVYYVYPDGQSWIIWAEGTQLLTFDKVTYLSVSEMYDLSDSDVVQDTTDHEMIIYISSGENSDEILNIFEQYISRTDHTPARLLFSDDYTLTYLLEYPD